MNAFIHTPLHVAGEQMLSRSYWYGANLVTVLNSAAETNGSFSLLKITLRKGFDPPIHVHSNEDESSYIMDGEILYQVGDRQIHARAGDFVHLPKSIPHGFKVLTETATTLLYITPGGFEQMFIRCSQPALSLELPPLPDAPPDPAFFATIARVSAELGVSIVPNL